MTLTYLHIFPFSNTTKLLFTTLTPYILRHIQALLLDIFTYLFGSTVHVTGRRRIYLGRKISNHDYLPNGCFSGVSPLPVVLISVASF